MSQFLCLAASLTLGACSSSGSDSAPDTSEFAGLWDASVTSPEGGRDERYVSISVDGRYTEYDYRQDGAASEGNCHHVTALTLEPLGKRDLESEGTIDFDGDGGLTDEDPIVIVSPGVPTYQLSDGRTISLLMRSLDHAFDAEEGYLTDEDPVAELYVVFDAGAAKETASGWHRVEGQSAADLAPCGGA